MTKEIKWIELYNTIDKDIDYNKEDSELLEDMKVSTFYSMKDENPKEFESLVKSLQKWAKEKRKAKQLLTIRLHTSDIDKIKQMASEEWIPYQTLISAIIHKIANKKIEIKIY